MKTIANKLKSETQITPEQGFPAIGSRHYLEYLPVIHSEQKPNLYFEIGTESGSSLFFSSCESIAVDPSFKLEPGAVSNKPSGVHLYEMTSDDFFASNVLKDMGKKIDLAFLDGMHLIEFLLRDFMNVEKFCSADATIVMHDCIPFSFVAARRDWDRSVTSSWTGDVWKIVPILKKYRPDLSVEALSLAPSGLIVIKKLAPGNQILQENYEKILKEFMEIELADYGLEKLIHDLSPFDPFSVPQSNAQKKN